MRRHGDRLAPPSAQSRLDHLRRRVVVRVPAWSYRTEHVPVPLVIVNVAPEFEQTPDARERDDAAGAFAATAKLVPNTAVAGACVDTVIVCVALCAFVVSRIWGAVLKLALPAWS